MKTKRNGRAGVKREQVEAIGSAEVEDVEDGDYGEGVRVCTHGGEGVRVCPWW